jgi:hypothetical protein
MSDSLNIENLSLKRGDTWRRTLLFTDDKGAAINITNWIIRFTVKESIDDTDTVAKIKKDITVHTNPTGGESLLVLTSTDTNLTGKFLYDIQVEDPNVTPKEVTTILNGTIEFIKDITTRTSS